MKKLVFFSVMCSLVIALLLGNNQTAKESEFKYANLDNDSYSELMNNEYFLFLKERNIDFIDMLNGKHDNFEKDDPYYIYSFLAYQNRTASAAEDYACMLNPTDTYCYSVIIVRNAIILAAKAGGYETSTPFAYRLLVHSLQNYPSDIYVNYDTSANKAIINEIKSTSIFQSNKNKAFSSFYLSSSTNLYLSLNAVDMYRIQTSNGVVAKTIWSIEDRYDFKWKNESSVFNDLGVIAQSFGAIRNYDVYITFEESINCTNGVCPWSTTPEVVYE